MTAESKTMDSASSDGSPKQALKGKQNNEEAGFLSLLKDLAFIITFFLVFSIFGWASFHIPSGSMEPTLEVGDRIFVSKLAYGYNRYSVYFDPAFLPEERLFSDTPERGDVAVFTLPKRGHEDFIKRVIGLPGDRIETRRGRLYINNELVERTFIRDVDYTDYRGYSRRVKEYDETLPGGVTHRIYEETDSGRWDNAGPYIVPAGHYFMMGDNRDNSTDSRSLTDIGYVSHAYYVGKAAITTFSLYDCDQGKDVFCPIGVPLGRFFNGIE